MKETIAILTQKGSLSKGLQENTIINLFKIEENKIKEVENIKLDDNSHNNFSRLMVIKQVSLVYIDTISNELRNILDRIGVRIKDKTELANDKFISQFIFE